MNVATTSPSHGPLLKRIDEISAGFKLVVTRDQRDTLDLRYGWRYTGPGEPTSFFVFLNGRTEWVEKYSYLAEDLGLPAGCGFLTWDHRGQGASGGARAFVEDYEDFAHDAQKIVGEVVGKKPYVLAAHSMGGLIGLYSVLKGYLTPRAMVLSSPLLGLPNEPVPRPLARPLARLLTACQLGAVSSGAGAFTKTPFERNPLTHHVELYQRMQNSPYRIPGATFGWVAASFKAIDFCFDPANLKNLKVPTLIMGGTKESVVDAEAFNNWVRTAVQHTKADVQLRLIPGGKHELLSEIAAYYEPAIAAMRAWLEPHWGA